MSEEGTSPRRLLALLAVAVLVLAALAYWAFSQRAPSSDADGPASGSPTPSAAAQSGAAQPAPSPTGSASTQTPAPSGTDAPGPLAAQDAEEVAEHALGAVGAALVDPAEATDMTQVLTGPHWRPSRTSARSGSPRSGPSPGRRVWRTRRSSTPTPTGPG